MRDAYRVGAERCIETKGRHPDSSGRIAKQGEFDQAIAELKKAIAIDPNVAEAYVCLGDAYEKQGNNEQAITHDKAFIRLARANPTLRSDILEVKRQIQIIEMKSELFDEQ